MKSIKAFSVVAIIMLAVFTVPLTASAQTAEEARQNLIVLLTQQIAQLQAQIVEILKKQASVAEVIPTAKNVLTNFDVELDDVQIAKIQIRRELQYWDQVITEAIKAEKTRVCEEVGNWDPIVYPKNFERGDPTPALTVRNCVSAFAEPSTPVLRYESEPTKEAYKKFVSLLAKERDAISEERELLNAANSKRVDSGECRFFFEKQYKCKDGAVIVYPYPADTAFAPSFPLK